MPSGVFMCKRCGDVEQCTACLLCGDPLCPKYHGVWDKEGDLSGCPHQMMNGDLTVARNKVVVETKVVVEKEPEPDVRWVAERLLSASYRVSRWIFGYTDCKCD